MTYAKTVDSELWSFFETHYKNMFHNHRSQVINERFTYSCYLEENGVTIVVTTPIYMNNLGEMDLASSRKIQISLIKTDSKDLLVRMKDVLTYGDWITRLNKRITDLVHIAESYSPKNGLDGTKCRSKNVRWRKDDV